MSGDEIRNLPDHGVPASARDSRSMWQRYRRTSADGFGTREFLRNDYMARMSSAVLGIYGNSIEEANYPFYFVDSERRPLNGASSRYTVRLGTGQLPPVNAFWSLTMYELPASLLTDTGYPRPRVRSSWCCASTGRSPRH